VVATKFWTKTCAHKPGTAATPSHSHELVITKITGNSFAPITGALGIGSSDKQLSLKLIYRLDISIFRLKLGYEIFSLLWLGVKTRGDGTDTPALSFVLKQVYVSLCIPDQAEVLKCLYWNRIFMVVLVNVVNKVECGFGRLRIHIIGIGLKLSQRHIVKMPLLRQESVIN